MKRIEVKVIPNSSHAKVEELSKDLYRVKVDAPPKEGKANKRLIEILQDYFDIPKSKIKITKGERSKVKIVEIGD